MTTAGPLGKTRGTALRELDRLEHTWTSPGPMSWTTVHPPARLTALGLARRWLPMSTTHLLAAP